MSTQVPSHFFIWVIWLFAIELYELFFVFWILTPYQIHGLQVFSPNSIGFLFTLVMVFFC